MSALEIAFPNPNKIGYERIPGPKDKRGCSRLGFAQPVSIQKIPVLCYPKMSSRPNIMS